MMRDSERDLRSADLTVAIHVSSYWPLVDVSLDLLISTSVCPGQFPHEVTLKKYVTVVA